MVMKNTRKRYILIEFMDDIPNVKEFNIDLRHIIAKLSGQILLARSGLHIMEYKSNMMIIRCTHKTRQVIEAALVLYTKNICNIITVTGTIKKIDRSLEDHKDELQ